MFLSCALRCFALTSPSKRWLCLVVTEVVLTVLWVVVTVVAELAVVVEMLLMLLVGSEAGDRALGFA